MAHQIDFSKGVAAAWSNKEQSWHGLGAVTEGYKNSEEILKYSGLDFDVVKEPLYLANGKLVDNCFATVRQDTGSPLGVVGSKYVVTQNTKAFEFFDSVIGLGDVTYQTAGALKDGRIIYVTAKLNEGMKINGTDPHDLYINFYNIHDGSGSLKIYPSMVRVVCNNTLSASFSENRSKKRGVVAIRHTINQDTKLSQALDILKITKEEFLEKKETLERFSTINLSTEVTKELALQLICDYDELDRLAQNEPLTNVLSAKKQGVYGNLLFSIDNGVGQKELANSAYKFLNGVTFYTSNIKGESQDRQYDTFFGSSLDLQNKAFQLINNYVTV